MKITTTLTLLFFALATSACAEDKPKTQEAQAAEQARVEAHVKAYQEKQAAEMKAKFDALLIQKRAEDEARKQASESTESHARGLASLYADKERLEQEERLQRALRANEAHYREQARKDLQEAMDRASDNLRYQQTLEFERRSQLTEIEFRQQMQEQAIQADQESQERAMLFYGR